MNLKTLSDKELFTLAKIKAQAEQKLTLENINIIREVDARRSFLQLGYGSLFDYVVKELGFDESAAWRRVDAARLIRQVSPDHTELKIVLPESLMAKLERLKSLLSHHNPNMSTVELLEKLVDLGLRNHDPLLKCQRKKKKAHSSGNANIENTEKSKGEHTEISAEQAQPLRLDAAAIGAPLLAAPQVDDWVSLSFREIEKASASIMKTRYITSGTKREVWNVYSGQCGFVDPLSGRRCESRHRLEIHHILPFAKGGSNDAGNLMMLCKLHNSHQAVKDYGRTKMEKFMLMLKD